MKARQYKKLCKKARALLIALGEPIDAFSQEYEHMGRLECAYVWGINTGPDYSGEYDWWDAWYILSNQVADKTATWEEHEENPYRTSITGTIGILRYARQMVETPKNAQA
ncbi:hypothetical protein [Microbulbifer sp. TRSA007]|uniref:hypothetical protein n=1 Tax=Microbulbifer sp. TRSA007 TaxID=3243384 RepID=UPI00403A1968